MTKADRERAIKKLRYMIGEVSAYCGECESMDEGAKEEIEALSIAIEALEQEPCEDAVSRQALIDLAKKGVLVSNGNLKSVTKAINGLPSVIPIRPKGKWIYEGRPKGMSAVGTNVYQCSVCGREIGTKYGWKTVGNEFPFCHCGADMRGEADKGVEE